MNVVKNCCLLKELWIFPCITVCLRVMTHSPIKMRDDRLVGYPSLSAGVPVDDVQASILSRYFVMLTGLSSTEQPLSRDVLQYFCTNYAKHMVQRVYFTRDESIALIVFASELGERTPGMYYVLSACNIYTICSWRCQLLCKLFTVLFSKEGSTFDEANGDYWLYTGILSWLFNVSHVSLYMSRIVTCDSLYVK